MPLPPTGPQTYAQWSDCLDRLASGLEDDACLAQMARGTLAWSGGVGPLFAQRLADEFNARLTRCSERLTRDLRAGADEASVVRAIVNARQSLFFLHRLAQLPAFAETLRSHLVREVRGFAERSQQSLEDSARADRSVNMDVGETILIESWNPDGTTTVKYRGAQWTAIHRPGVTPSTGMHRVAELVGNRLLVDPV